MKEKKIKLSMTIGEVLEKHPKAAEILAKNFDSMCLGCPMSRQETLKEAATHHSIDAKKLLAELNN